jgi:enediyne biosynthesis protein E4
MLRFATNKGRFERADSGVSKPLAARGVAFGDINNDGSIDAVISCLGGPPVLLLNRGGGTNHWLSISLQGTRSNRDGYGARVTVNGQTRSATSTGSYLCANDKRLHFGLGASEKATVEILWPSGTKQIINDARVDQFLQVREPERS